MLMRIAFASSADAGCFRNIATEISVFSFSRASSFVIGFSGWKPRSLGRGGSPVRLWVDSSALD